MNDAALVVPTVRLRRGALRLIDQTRLPGEYVIVERRDVDGVVEAIRALRVRGAPAIGLAAAYGLLVAVEARWGDERTWFFDSEVPDAPASSARGIERFPADVPVRAVVACLEAAREALAASRPTAVNLHWALDRMARGWRDSPVDDARSLLRRLLAEADAIHTEDLAMCRAIGRHGAALIADGDAVLTHCNTGGLATSGFGTALGIVFTAVAEGRRVHVFADETRPLLQGARLTAWECRRAGIPVDVLVDGAAASLIASGRVACAIVGADRIAANGDTANKVGTLGLAVACHRYGVPFYVAAPSSTIDASLPDGSGIPIEQRGAGEVLGFAGVRTTPDGVGAWNPAFDVTPAGLISAIVTERGVHRPPYRFDASPR